MKDRWPTATDEETGSLEEKVFKAASCLVSKLYGPTAAKRLEQPGTINHGRALLREMLTEISKATIYDASDTEELIRREAQQASEKLIKAQNLIDSIPEELQEKYRRYAGPGALTVFDSAVFNSFSYAAVYYKRRSRPPRGRPADKILSVATERCINLLEYLAGKKFTRNFDVADPKKKPAEFINPDCLFCETILVMINPTLTHARVKSALRLHFIGQRLTPGSSTKKGPSSGRIVD